MKEESCWDLDLSATPVSGSRVVRFQDGFRWEGIPVARYKHADGNWSGVSRTTLVGDQGEKSAFHVRYFEIAPGGFTTLEQHAHEHAVLVLRGRGQVVLGEQTHDLHFGDLVYVGPREQHQFRNSAIGEPLGILCIVDAQRDKPLLNR